MFRTSEIPQRNTPPIDRENRQLLDALDRELQKTLPGKLYFEQSLSKVVRGCVQEVISSNGDSKYIETCLYLLIAETAARKTDVRSIYRRSLRDPQRRAMFDRDFTTMVARMIGQAEKLNGLGFDDQQIGAELDQQIKLWILVLRDDVRMSVI